jgi:hypothetical protein
MRSEDQESVAVRRPMAGVGWSKKAGTQEAPVRELLVFRPSCSIHRAKRGTATRRSLLGLLTSWSRGLLFSPVLSFSCLI